MWADNFQKYDESNRPILTPNDPIYNGRVNLLDSNAFWPTGTNDTTAYFKMFEKTAVKHSITDYRGALENIWYESKLSKMYFSAKNIQLIQYSLKDAIYKKSNGRYKLLPQNEDELKIIMRSYYLQYTQNDVGNEDAELKRINGLVLNYLIPRLMNESVGYEQYLNDQTTLVVPLARSQQVDRDFKELQYQPFMTDWK